eukprot:471641_1
MSSLRQKLNPATVNELCSIELHVNKANGRRNCKHCNKLIIFDKFRFELKIKPRPGSLLRIGESLYFHLSCWLNNNNIHRINSFNYKQCIGWNKLKRTIQNDILRINGGYSSDYGMIQEHNNNYKYNEPPKKKRKLNLKKKRLFKPPRIIKLKNKIESENENESDTDSEHIPIHKP